METHTNQSDWLSDWIVRIACALLMFQVYLLAPLHHSLGVEFNSSFAGLAIPAFAFGFALAAAGVGYFRSVVKPYALICGSLIALSAGTLLLSAANSVTYFLLLRFVAGLGTGALLPAALLMKIVPGDNEKSLAHMTAVLFALATGMTFGPSVGGWLNGGPGWRSVFVASGLFAALLYLLLRFKFKPDQSGLVLDVRRATERPAAPEHKIWYIRSFVLLTGVFHSGVFVWIVNFLMKQYGLNEFEIGTALLIFGLPGLVVGILMNRYHLDKHIITVLYAGLAVTITGLFILLGKVDLWIAELLLAVISVGFSCSQPLFIGILNLPHTAVSAVRSVARGCAILFTGYGLGPVIMSRLVRISDNYGVIFLLALVFTLGLISRHVWQNQKVRVRNGSAGPALPNGRQEDSLKLIR